MYNIHINKTAVPWLKFISFREMTHIETLALIIFYT